MSTNYVKKYGVGNINLDTFNSNSISEPPYLQYIHELPLLSFCDVQHNVVISLVFNYERYREEKTNNENPFSIAPGYKLNLQKRLIYNDENDPISFQEENGRIVALTSFGNVFSFNDDSQRILRITSSGITLEYPDYSRENYNSAGRITAAYDKYSNDAVLTYSYNSDGNIESITYRNSKTISLVYESNRLKSIGYGGHTSIFNYDDSGMLDSIDHYTGVKYKFTLSEVEFASEVNSFDLHKSDFKVDATATEGEATIILSKELKLRDDRVTIDIIDKIGNNEVNKSSYKSPTNLLNYGPPFKYVDITDNNGVETRTQFENGKVMCSYEIKNGEPQFYGNTPQSKFAGNVNLYNTADASDANKAIGIQAHNSGWLMNYNSTNYKWVTENVVADTLEEGYYTLSGWIKSKSEDVSSDIIRISGSSDDYLEVDLEPVGQWKYFSFMFYSSADVLTVFTDMGNSVSTRDFRITFQETGVKTDDDASHIMMSKYVLLNGSSEIRFSNAQFYYSTSSGDVPISGDEDAVTFSDVIRYKMRKKRDGASDEVYYNNCKNIVTGVTDLKVLHNGALISVSDFDLGMIVYSGRKRTFTRINVDEDDRSSDIVRTCTVTTKYEEENEEKEISSLVSTEKLDSNLNVIESIADGVTTEYLRNSLGLITKESVLGLYTHVTEYGDALITVKDVDLEDETNILSTARYHINTTWGGVYKVEAPDGSVITDTYDGDMSSLVQKAFDNSSTRKNDFGYSSGRLASVTEGGLGYAFEYTEKGELGSVIKNNASIEHHAYSKSNGETTVESKYPSENSALYTETKAFDKYGRLKSISGILQNVYDLDPYWYYEAQNGEPEQVTKGVDGKDAMLAQTTDSLTGKVTKYGYSNGQLTAAVTYDTEDSVLSQETFVYDKAGRLTKDHFNYGTPDSSITTDITYLKTENDPLADGRIATYSYKINGTEKASSSNTYDAYKRLASKRIDVINRPFTKTVSYDKTRISRVVDEDSVVNIHDVTYTYDAMGRITSEVDSVDTSFNNSYVYDAFGQLIRENNKALDKTFIYGYNEIGNITSAKAYAYTTGDVSGLTALSTDSYTYDTNLKDKLTHFGTAAVPCNAMGYHSGYNGYLVSWTNRKISKLTKGILPIGMHDYNYSYNALGQRVGISYTYTPPRSPSSSPVAMGTLLGYSKSYDYDQSGRLISESSTNEYYGELGDSEKIVFLYDEAGMVGFVYTKNGASNTYYYDKNIRGDVLGIYDANGTRIVKYSYDAWGNCTIDSSTTNTALAKINPIRYRGYYYDEDIKLYYLNSRYYSPAWRRFISPATANALNPESVNGLNLYVYANNDPVSASYNNSVTGNRQLLTSPGRHIAQYSYSTYSPSTLYDALGFASNVFAIINGVKVAEYLTHIHGNPPPVSWFLNNVSKLGKISGYIGSVAAVVDGIQVYINTSDVGLAVWTTAFDVAGMIVASKLGGLLGGLIAGPLGAIVGTLAIIAIESLIQNYKEDVVNWLDKTFDNLGKWISHEWSELLNA